LFEEGTLEFFISVFIIRVSNKWSHLLKHIVFTRSNNVEGILEQNVHSVKNETGSVCSVSGTLQLDNISWLDGCDGTLSLLKSRKSCCEFFIGLFLF